MFESAYHLVRPAQRTTSVVFASPHSGRDYPATFLNSAVLNAHEIRSSEDAYVDQLFAGAPDHGAPLLSARAPRAYLDLNRAPDELDSALIEGVRRHAHNPRIASGLGVIPRVVANGRHIYRGKLSLVEAHTRIARYWRPYHDQLQTLLDESNNQFGEAILIDCHSMPHEALENVAPPGSPRPDIVLGDRFGATAAARVVERVEMAFDKAGLRVARNMPFAGAFITQHYGRPPRGQHAIQVEIDRALYMNEKTLEPHAGFDAFVHLLDGVIADLAEIGRPDVVQVAAE
ncbi:N-formylglutamate amidohydrolase [Yoonia sediminilitoris]|uniref:N-formylglutamate amidohydrolase n=1 Tax=Yoonia sediminilitoris TaxID=1286148 RepID=A0A2T6K8H1_9RHOB|nr:N-formylglutamate amidohydrolase [Yoonia sediminilitoris]PUB11036.1 N-formylglutamate amidohydrolase [Yoonia sediminilitoris]RCW90955.1 N-formylglutamate amidohydrolase [Yoonia sediminilitoris]